MEAGYGCGVAETEGVTVGSDSVAATVADRGGSPGCVAVGESELLQDEKRKTSKRNGIRKRYSLRDIVCPSCSKILKYRCFAARKYQSPIVNCLFRSRWKAKLKQPLTCCLFGYSG